MRKRQVQARWRCGDSGFPEPESLPFGRARSSGRTEGCVFLIKHPEGNISFDTGDNDRIIKEPTYWGPLAGLLDLGTSTDLAIDTQLEKVGIKATDINYVILGHGISTSRAMSANSRTRPSSCKETRSRTRAGRDRASLDPTSRPAARCRGAGFGHVQARGRAWTGRDRVDRHPGARGP
jgi:hypothetical protein